MPPKKKPKIVERVEYGPNLDRILPPIVVGATLELLKKGQRIHVQHPRDSDTTVVYILPQQPMACATCGLLSTNLESFERHKCKHATNSTTKYVPSDTLKLVQAGDPPHVFTYRWGESCLLHRNEYNYACICGAVCVRW